MKVTSTGLKSAIAAAGIAVAGVFGTGTALAGVTPNIQPFGATEQLVLGRSIVHYTVNAPHVSNIAIRGFSPKGTLYEADVTAMAARGTVTPMVRDFMARGPNGQNYHVISRVPTPFGLNPAPIPQGSVSVGKLYFDVTGAPPDGIVYNAGLQDVLIWTSNMQGPGAPVPGPVPGGPPMPAPYGPPAPSQT